MNITKLLSTAFQLYASERLEHELKQSLFMQDRDARFFRTDAVIQLSIEYGKARARSIFSSAFGRAAIEYMMLGDWKEARAYADLLQFHGEGEEVRSRYAPVWETFVTMVHSLCDEAERIERGEPYNRSKN